jgi:hypothetical protein
MNDPFSREVVNAKEKKEDTAVVLGREVTAGGNETLILPCFLVGRRVENGDHPCKSCF